MHDKDANEQFAATIEEKDDLFRQTAYSASLRNDLYLESNFFSRINDMIILPN